MKNQSPDAHSALNYAKAAYQCGDTIEAKKWASTALQQDPSLEEAWLILAALASPRASIAYFKFALRYHPNSLKAKSGLRWAYGRLLDEMDPVYEIPKIPGEGKQILISGNFSHETSSIKNSRKSRNISFILPLFFILGLLLASFLVWISIPTQVVVFADNFSRERPDDMLIKPSLTPTNTVTAFPTATASPTVTITPTLTHTGTQTPTETSIPTITFTPTLPSGLERIPEGIGSEDKWIDVNLSTQMIYALEGNGAINSYMVSTGKDETPTVTGLFSIYVKLKSAPMRGDDYYYSEIPYILYFYGGYGFHGVTWPLKLGVPTSNGCVNMITPDAEWLYDWADVGTFVYVHY